MPRWVLGVSLSEREYLCNTAANDIMDSGSVTTDSLVKIMKAMAKTEIILDDGSSVKIIPKCRKVTYRLVSGLTQVESYKPLYLKKMLKRLNGHPALHTTVPLPSFSKLPQPKISVQQNNNATISQHTEGKSPEPSSSGC
ncbi:hypothetical protein [Sodalis praecaptivus]|uniref:hypothetical protein n=1 Tax=Sodalis TaxID=84565 RepID=UPI0011DD74D4|nr:hypothetical protein [Sodalis praecaptivus]